MLLNVDEFLNRMNSRFNPLIFMEALSHMVNKHPPPDTKKPTGKILLFFYILSEERFAFENADENRQEFFDNDSNCYAVPAMDLIKPYIC